MPNTRHTQFYMGKEYPNFGGGGSSGGGSVLYGTSAPTSSQGDDGSIYVQYSETTYRRISYIESIGGEYRNAIDTGYKMTTDSSLIFETYVSNAQAYANWEAILSARFNSPWYGIYTRSQGNYVYSFELNNQTADSRITQNPCFYNKRFTIEADANEWSWSDGTDTYSMQLGLSGTTDSNILLLSNGQYSGEAPKGRIYDFKLFENGSLKQHLIPILDSNGVPCVADLVTDSIIHSIETNKVFLYDSASETQYKNKNVVKVYYKIDGEWIS